MRPKTSRKNLQLIGLASLLVIALIASVVAAHRFSSYWLLERDLAYPMQHARGTVEGMEYAAESASDFKNKGLAANSLGMRLSTHNPNELTLGSNIISAKMRQKLASLFAPSKILSETFVDLSGGHENFILKPHLDAFAQKNNFRVTEIQKVVDLIYKTDDTATITHMSWTGKSYSRSLVAIPLFVDQKLHGALLLWMDHQKRIESLSKITRFTTMILSGICILSFLTAAFLLWWQFYEKVRKNTDIEFMAHHDALTKLPNRSVFNARLSEALRVAQPQASDLGVMLIDVDKFKEINDTYGHGTGDIFLQIVAERLRTTFTGHLVSRLSGDEFAVMFQSIDDIPRLTTLAENMIDATKAPCVIDGKELRISLSIGVARASDGNWRASKLLHCADLALYKSKHSGRSTFSWYSEEMDKQAKLRKEIEEDLGLALEQDQFEILFQPQYSLLDNKLKAYECLLRWEHPTKGHISPDIFIPIAEDCGLIEEIGNWVLRHACLEAAQWEDTELRVAVNVSPAQFKPDLTEKMIARALKESGLASHRLEIEITESLLIANTEAVVQTLNTIRLMGVSIAMDDFGTGYSSLSYLNRFPFDKIKIDHTFIRNLGKDKNTDAIVASIVGLGRSLDVLITAEGVETEDQITLLKAAGCHLVQGYYYGKPNTVAAHQKSLLKTELTNKNDEFHSQPEAAQAEV